MERLLIFLFVLLLGCNHPPKFSLTEVLVIGEGTGATSAAIQAARSGAKTTLITPIPWLGGMLTAAGVSATDGNHRLPAGLWGEFRDSLRNHYGGADSLFTGWVSNTMFEPKVGDYYWKQIAKQESNLTILYNTQFKDIVKENHLWKIQYEEGGTLKERRAIVVIDGTDLGDVAALAGATFDIGMDKAATTGESTAPKEANDIIQDLTYAAILKDYGPNQNKTIPQPVNYDPSQFYCSCQKFCDDPAAKPHPCETMLTYGKLPNNKYMINWPIKGNDFYANIIEKSPAERVALLNKAKQKTLQFIYFIQHDLGYTHLGIAKDEFPTADGLPLMPYHREGRRIHGLVQLNVNHIINPYHYDLYKTGIAVGDYPIDHHHYERPDAPEINFPKVPSFNIPLGALIPKGLDNFLVADKSISVTNIVNGSSRLQPVIVQIGQVAGLVAALAVGFNTSPQNLNVRNVQRMVIENNGYLLPYLDVPPTHPYFENIQKIGATGLLKGNGIPYKWANQTWFYPDTTITQMEFFEIMASYSPNVEQSQISDPLTISEAKNYLASLQKMSADQVKEIIQKTPTKDLLNADKNRPIIKAELAFLIDQMLDPFSIKINMEGETINK